MKLILIFLLTLSNASGFSKIMLYCDEALLIESENVALEEIRAFDHQFQSKRYKYLISVGLKGEYAFCAAAQYYCFAEACSRLNISITQIPIIKSGAVSRIFEESKKSGSGTHAPISRHSLVIWRYPKCCRGHIERVLNVLENGWVRTLAFNTDCNGTKNSACIKLRNTRHPLGRMMLKGIIIFRTKFNGANNGK